MIIYTANYGNHDVLKKQPKQKGCRFICFTDNPDIQQEDWAQREIIVDKTYCHLHPRLTAKWYRTHPYEVFPEEGWLMYMDSNGRLLREDSVEYFMNLLGSNDILAFKHPDRDCIYDEAKVCKEKPKFKYLWVPLYEQVEHYRRLWRPEHAWLSATWLLLHYNNRILKQAMHDWYYENLLWTYQDQLGFDYVMDSHNIKRWWILDNLRHNDYISFNEWHLSLK